MLLKCFPFIIDRYNISKYITRVIVVIKITFIKVSITLSIPIGAIAWGIYAIKESSIAGGISSISFGAAFIFLIIALVVSKKSPHGIQQYPSIIIWSFWILFLLSALTCAISAVIAV